MMTRLRYCAGHRRQVIASQIAATVTARPEVRQRQIAPVEQGTGQHAAGEFGFPQRAVIEDDRADGADLIKHREIQLAAGEHHVVHGHVLEPGAEQLARVEPGPRDLPA